MWLWDSTTSAKCFIKYSGYSRYVTEAVLQSEILLVRLCTLTSEVPLRFTRCCSFSGWTTWYDVKLTEKCCCFFFFFLLERSTRYLSFLLSSCTFCSIVFCISCSVAPRLILSHCTVTHSQLSVGWEGFPPRRLACSHWKQLLEKLTVVSKSLPCFFSTLLHPRIFFLSCLR